MNEDGTMARLPELIELAKKFKLKIISIADLISYRLRTESLVEMGVEVNMPTAYGDFRLIPFRQISNGMEHVALIKGTWEKDEPILVRVHSSCMTGDIFGSQRCECGEQLHEAMQLIEKEGKEVLYDKLVEIDPVAAQKYDDKNPRRVMRALEYYYSKGKKLSDAHIQSIKEKEFKIIYFGVQKPREILYDLINERVLNMWEAGLENETKNILEMGYPETLNSLQTVGYKETLSYIKGNITKEEAIYLIQRNTRRYAKRQMTWFRSLENIIWIENREDIIKYLKQIVSRETLKDE